MDPRGQRIGPIAEQAKQGSALGEGAPAEGRWLLEVRRVEDPREGLSERLLAEERSMCGRCDGALDRKDRAGGLEHARRIDQQRAVVDGGENLGPEAEGIRPCERQCAGLRAPRT